MKKTPVQISAVSSISALSPSQGELADNLKNRTPANSLTFDESLFPGKVCPLGWLPEPLPALPKELVEFDSTFGRIIYKLFSDLKQEIFDTTKRVGRERLAIVFGSSTSGVDASEAPFSELRKTGAFPEDYHFFHQEIGAGSVLLSRLCQTTGPAYTISTACSSGAKVFASARRMLEQDVADAVLVGGADSLCKVTTHGFAALELVSENITNPFSLNRNGLSIGEGGALFLLTKKSGGLQLKGIGESSDAYHVATPDPSGSGAARAMEQAIADANRNSKDVCYLNLHGTGTIANDAMESLAVQTVLGEEVGCSSTKPLTGHLLGAAGAYEAAICCAFLRESELNGTASIPKHHWDGEADPKIAKIKLASDSSKVELSANSIALSNSFAFGGSNCCLAFGIE